MWVPLWRGDFLSPETCMGISHKLQGCYLLLLMLLVLIMNIPSWIRKDNKKLVIDTFYLSNAYTTKVVGVLSRTDSTVYYIL